MAKDSGYLVAQLFDLPASVIIVDPINNPRSSVPPMAQVMSNRAFQRQTTAMMNRHIFRTTRKRSLQAPTLGPLALFEAISPQLANG